MALNRKNFGIAFGALTRPVQFRTNNDGSQSALLTLAIHNDRNNAVSYLDFNRYVPVQATNLLNKLQGAQTGDLAYINYHPEKYSYSKDGKKVYRLRLAMDQITLISGNHGQNNNGNDEADNDSSSQKNEPEDMPF